MKAAVLHAYGTPPRYEDFPTPTRHEHEALVTVKAASLKNIDRGIAGGAHYHRLPSLPAVCGVDGVGVLADGTRVYCGGCPHPYGMMAEETVIPQFWAMPVPEGLDDLTAAALPNPALSSWLPLVYRAGLQPGERVLILGATGAAGKLAVQIAKHLGAGRVVAAGRNEAVLAALPALGADATLRLGAPEAEVAAAFRAEHAEYPFDIVLDFVWGRPTELLLEALTGHDVQAAPVRTRLVQIGEMAGATIALPAATLRSTGVELYGSGGGSIPRRAVGEVLPQLFALAARGTLRIETEPVALADVERVWQAPARDGRRIVFIP